MTRASVEIDAARATPVAIGGLGGSGTRVVINILEALDFHVGPWLNEAGDNEAFIRVFKNPSIGERRRRRTAPSLDSRVHTFWRFMSGQRLNPRDVLRLSGGLIPKRPDKTARRLATLAPYLRSRVRTPGPEAVGIAWKEPHTHLFLEPLAQELPNLRYIHVIRHGLDMAFSGNTTQLELFGRDFGVVSPTGPSAQLDYWIAANGRALDTGSQLFGDRMYALSFDALCADPSSQILQLADFVDADPGSAEHQSSMEALVRTPSSLGRHRDQDLSVFTDAQLAQVEKLGFSVPARGPSVPATPEPPRVEPR